MILFFAGIALSLAGSLPPGLISLSVAQTSILRGFWSAIVLALGAAFAEFFQAWVAVAFSNWFLDYPDAARGFQMAAIPIFLGLAVYLWFFARPPRTPDAELPVAPLRQLSRGMLISVFNLLAIPYWVAYAGWLRVNNYWKEGLSNTLLFAFGVTVGTMAALALYAWLAQELMRRSDMVARLINRFVALIFLGLGIKLLVQVW
ncbi:MAG: hypothetical protein EP344_18210 [Bacteroidetes bacterium]|nr:MAG: hypothetical protein EP344_18210 [Bacteroidota bacterium]